MAVMSLPPADGDPSDPTPAVARVRLHLNVVGGHVRAKTIPNNHLGAEEKRDAEYVEYPDVERPKTRGECSGQARPCPWISCVHHLFLDVNPETGALKLNFPHLDVWEMEETCSLDVADRQGATLEEVGRLYGLTRERIRQYEVRGLAKIRDDDAGGELGVPPERP